MNDAIRFLDAIEDLTTEDGVKAAWRLAMDCATAREMDYCNGMGVYVIRFADGTEAALPIPRDMI